MYVIPKFTPEDLDHKFVSHYDTGHTSSIDSSYKWTIECSCGWFAPDQNSYNGLDHHVSWSAAEEYYKVSHFSSVGFIV